MAKDEKTDVQLKLKCPNCAKPLSNHVDQTDKKFTRKPLAGDMSVCLYCAHYLLFKMRGLKLTLVKAKLEDLPAEYHNQLQQARDLIIQKRGLSE